MESQWMLIKKHFALSDEQINKLQGFAHLLQEWNQRINLISRKDIENIWIHHIAHSLAPLKFIDFTGFKTIADLGTGGGFPGIPLAIIFPDRQFILIDSRNKKIKALEDIVQKLDLKNVNLIWSRAELLSLCVDLICVRAVANPRTILKWTKKWYSENNALHYLFYRGSETVNETQKLPLSCKHYDLFKYLPFDYFRGKIVSFCRRKKNGS